MGDGVVVGTGVSVGIGVGVAVGSGIGVFVGVDVGDGVVVGTGVSVGIGVSVAVGSGVTPGCAVTVGLGAAPADGVGLGSSEHPANSMAKSIAAAPSRPIAMDFDIVTLLCAKRSATIASTLAFHMTRRKIRLYLIRWVLFDLSYRVQMNLASALERRTLL